MQPSSHAVCVNMQPYGDGYGKNAEPPSPLQARSPAAPPPKDFVLWSLFNFSFLNCCCLGFAALVFSIKARDRKVLGDHNGAGSYGSTAKCLNIMALLLSILSIIVLIILAATGAIATSY